LTTCRHLIVARRNDRITAGTPRRWLANRDVLRIEFWDEVGEARVAIVRRMTGRDRTTGEIGWSEPFELAEDYLERHAELAYAGNVHVAEGRTVETTHLVVDETAGRESLYVGVTRCSARNTAYVITERTRTADLSPLPRPAPALDDPAAAQDAPPHRLTVLAQTLEREQAQRTATQTMRQELEQSASLATLAPIWADVTRAHATRQYETILQPMLTPQEWQRYEHDPERGTFTPAAARRRPRRPRHRGPAGTARPTAATSPAPAASPPSCTAASTPSPGPPNPCLPPATPTATPLKDPACGCGCRGGRAMIRGPGGRI
jgi:hypothetical protein